MQASELIKQARDLPLKEQLRVVEALWDAIAESNATPPLTQWQQTELDRREDLYHKGQEQLVDAMALHDALRRRS